MNKSLSAAGLGPKQHSKPRTGHKPQHPSSCAVSPDWEQRGKWRRNTSVGQFRSHCGYCSKALCQSKADHTRGVATELMCHPGPQDKGSTAHKPEKQKACSKTYAPSSECNLSQRASNSDFSALALPITQVSPLLPMVTPPPAPWKDKC